MAIALYAAIRRMTPFSGRRKQFNCALTPRGNDRTKKWINHTGYRGGAVHAAGMHVLQRYDRERCRQENGSKQAMETDDG
jgi:hypothetical protein